MTPGQLWIVAGLALCGADMLALGVFLLPVGLAALAAGGMTDWLGLGWNQQLLLFVALMAALVGVAVLWRRRTPARTDPVNAPHAGLIGAACHALAFEGNEGRVSLGDGTWLARVTDGATPAAGSALRVVGLDGTTLLVTREPSRDIAPGAGLTSLSQGR